AFALGFISPSFAGRPLTCHRRKRQAPANRRAAAPPPPSPPTPHPRTLSRGRAQHTHTPRMVCPHPVTPRLPPPPSPLQALPPPPCAPSRLSCRFRSTVPAAAPARPGPADRPGSLRPELNTAGSWSAARPLPGGCSAVGAERAEVYATAAAGQGWGKGGAGRSL